MVADSSGREEKEFCKVVRMLEARKDRLSGGKVRVCVQLRGIQLKTRS